MADPKPELQRLLREQYKLVDTLPAAEQARLLELIGGAQRRQRDAVVAAQQHALRFVPAVLRKPLLKLLTE